MDLEPGGSGLPKPNVAETAVSRRFGHSAKAQGILGGLVRPEAQASGYLIVVGVGYTDG